MSNDTISRQTAIDAITRYNGVVDKSVAKRILIQLPPAQSELKPCPFCGNEVEVEKIPLWYGNGHGYKDCYEFRIRCKKCGCSVYQHENDSVYRSEEEAEKNAVIAWNRRVSDE